MCVAALAVGGGNRDLARRADRREPRGAALGRAGARDRTRARRGLRVLPCRGRAALVCRAERLYRERRRCDDARGHETANPRHRPGAVRPGAMVAVRGVAGRLEPVRFARDGGDLRRCLPSHSGQDIASTGDGMSPERPPYLPGDPAPESEIAAMIRVDHAGEYGAVRIYDGQLAIIGRGRARDEISHMAEQEKRHLAAFDAHYQGQAERLGAADPVLSETIQSFRADELAHRQTAIEHGATEALGYELISAVVKTGSRLAIWLSTRL